MTERPKGETPRWLDDPSSPKRLVWALVGACGLVVVADFFYDKHGHFGWESLFGFHAAYGFASYVGLVAVAVLLRKLVHRNEDYYD